MTSFNRKNAYLDPEDWQRIAFKNASEDNSQIKFIGSFVAAGLASVAISPLTGVLVGGLGVYWCVKTVHDKGRSRLAVRDYGLVAPFLDDHQFANYSRQVIEEEGADKLIEELVFAAENDIELSDAAYDFIERYAPNLIEGSSPQNLLTSTVSSVSSRLDAFNGVQTESGNYQPKYNIDLIDKLTDRITNTLIIGTPGTGKGMILANAIRSIKSKYPGHKVFMIDPKGDEREAAYFDGIVDRFESKECEHLSPSEVTDWIKWCFDQYHKYAEMNGKCLLILDEGMIVGQKFVDAKDNFIKNQVINIASLGDSKGKNIWVCSQSPYVKSLGLDLNSTSQMSVIGIVREAGIIEQWTKAGVKLAKIAQEDLSNLIDKSADEIGEGRGRAVYFGKDGKWYAMPKLQNFSSYDRDTGETLKSSAPPKDALSKDERESLRRATNEGNTITVEAKPVTETDKIIDLLTATKAQTLAQFVYEDLAVSADRVKEMCDAIRAMLESCDRTDLLNFPEIDCYQAFNEWMRSLDYYPSDVEINHRWLLLTGQILTDGSRKMLMERIKNDK